MDSVFSRAVSMKSSLSFLSLSKRLAHLIWKSCYVLSVLLEKKCWIAFLSPEKSWINFWKPKNFFPSGFLALQFALLCFFKKSSLMLKRQNCIWIFPILFCMQIHYLSNSAEFLKSHNGHWRFVLHFGKCPAELQTFLFSCFWRSVIFCWTVLNLSSNQIHEKNAPIYFCFVLLHHTFWSCFIDSFFS